MWDQPVRMDVSIALGRAQWPLLGQVLTLYWTDLIDIWEVPEEARVAIVVVGGGGLMGNLGQMLFTKK